MSTTESFESRAARRPPEEPLSLGGELAVANVVQTLHGDPDRSVELGRFELRRVLGEGAFGRVYLGFDPELRRRVAIKVLRQPTSSRALAQLRREAQAMAALEHPALLRVHEIGRTQAEMFIVMELAEGGSLRDWAREDSRAPKEIAEKGEAAARGLQRAHQAGLVHRDVKPSNILLSKDGSVRVADFGLVFELEADPAQAGRGRRTASAGTPAYMAPELFDGEPASPASDQYALAVTLFELTYGDGSVREPPRHKEDIPRRALSTGRLVPTWLRRILRRALCTDPTERFGSMEEFANALRRGLATRRRRLRLGVGLTGIAVAVGIGATMPREERGPDCADRLRELDTIWSSDRANAIVSAAMTRGDASYALEAARRVVSLVDRHARSWARVHEQSCPVVGERSRDIGDCLERNSERLRGFLDAYDPADGPASARAISVSANLSPPTDCLPENLPRPDPARLRPRFKPGPEVERARAHTDLGDPSEAIAILEPMLGADATSSEARAARAELQLEAGRALERLGEERRALELFEAAVLDGAASGNDSAVAAASRMLARELAELGRVDRASRYAETAEVFVDHLGARPVDRVAVLTARGSVAENTGKLDRARALFEAAADLARDHGVPKYPALNDLATVLRDVGRAEEALVVLEEALSDASARLGPEHPSAAGMWMNVGTTRTRLGDPSRAVEALQNAEAGFARAYSEDHPAVASALMNRVEPLLMLDRADEAAASARRALEITGRTSGEASESFAKRLGVLSSALYEQGKLREAGQAVTDSLARLERLPAARPLTLAYARRRVAQWNLLLGRLEPSIAHNEAVVEYAKSTGRVRLLRHAYLELSLASLERGALQVAVDYAKEARDLSEHVPSVRAQAAVVLARVEARRSGDPKALEAAIDALGPTGGVVSDVHRARAWLDLARFITDETRAQTLRVDASRHVDLSSGPPYPVVLADR